MPDSTSPPQVSESHCFKARLARLVAAAGPLATVEADMTARRRVLRLLADFAVDTAAHTDMPAFLREADQDGLYGVHCVHDDPAGWSLAAVVMTPGQQTPPHDHDSWGAAVTVMGVESNRRYRGTCPDQLTLFDEQLAPVGGGYLFAAGDIHQAACAAPSTTVSLHLLVKGGPHAHQRCKEPPRTSG